MWWAFYLFSIAAGQPLLNWTATGPVFLTCLFVLPHASLDVTEVLSSRKYAGYAAYQQRVSRFLPLPPRPAGVPPPLRLADKGFVLWFVVGTAITCARAPAPHRCSSGQASSVHSRAPAERHPEGVRGGACMQI